MIAVIFELEPKSDQIDSYFELAGALQSLLEEIDGFISIERFQSVTSPNKFLSLSFWRDEDAVLAWRNQDLHRLAQTQGRQEVLADYRLRVAVVQRDYGMNNREQVPLDSKQLHK